MLEKSSTAWTSILLIVTTILPAYSQAPDTLWTKTYGGPGADYCRSLQQTSDGGYALIGHTTSFGAGDWDTYFVKTDSNGDTLWTRKYGGSLNEYSYALENTFDGGYIVAGRTSSYGMGMYDFYLIRTDSLGDTLWTRSYGGPAWDGGRSVQQTSDSGFIVVGWTDSFGPLLEYDIYAVKTDFNGNILWSNLLGGSDQDYGYSVIETSDFGYAIVGFTFSFGFAAGEFYLIKTAPDTLGLAETQVKTPAIQNYQLVFPNPFRDNIEISLSVETCENDISLEIIDITGRFIRDLQREDGTNDHSVTATWDGLSWHGKEVPQGIYFLVIRMQNSVITSRIVKIR